MAERTRKIATLGRYPAIACLVLLLAGCANPIFYWGTYEDSLVANYLDTDPDEAYAELEKTLAHAERKNLRLGPGLNAEFGFLLYQRGQVRRAVEFFEREAIAFPESATLMKTLIETVEKREEKTDPVGSIR